MASRSRGNGKSTRSGRRSRWLRPVVAATLVVVVAAAVLALRRGFRRAQENARRAQCLSNMGSLGLAFQMYLQKNGGFMPPADQRQDGYYWVPYVLGDEDQQRPRYFGMPAVMLLCFSHMAREGRDAFPWEGESGDQAMPYLRAEPERYLRYVGEPALAGRHEDSLPASAVLMLWEDGPYHGGGRCVCWFDGRAEWLEETTFAEALAESRDALTSTTAGASQ